MEQLYNKTDNGYELNWEKARTPITLEIKETIEFTYQNLEALIESAFSGSPITWGKIDKSAPEWKTKPKNMSDTAFFFQLLISGEVVNMRSIEDKHMIWNLSLEDVYAAIKVYAGMVEDYSADIFDRVDAPNKILQIALFAGIDFD